MTANSFWIVPRKGEKQSNSQAACLPGCAWLLLSFFPVIIIMQSNWYAGVECSLASCLSNTASATVVGPVKSACCPAPVHLSWRPLRACDCQRRHAAGRTNEYTLFSPQKCWHTKVNECALWSMGILYTSHVYEGNHAGRRWMDGNMGIDIF